MRLEGLGQLKNIFKSGYLTTLLVPSPYDVNHWTMKEHGAVV
jgi:hypothetical protein